MGFFDTMQVYGLGIVTVIVFMVNIIVELTKNTSFLKSIPTTLYTIVLSIVLTCLTYTIGIELLDLPFVWYELVLSFLAGFPIAYVAMFGWEKISELWNRTKR